MSRKVLVWRDPKVVGWREEQNSRNARRIKTQGNTYTFTQKSEAFRANTDVTQSHHLTCAELNSIALQTKITSSIRLLDSWNLHTPPLLPSHNALGGPYEPNHEFRRHIALADTPPSTNQKVEPPHAEGVADDNSKVWLRHPRMRMMEKIRDDAGKPGTGNETLASPILSSKWTNRFNSGDAIWCHPLLGMRLRFRRKGHEARCLLPCSSWDQRQRHVSQDEDHVVAQRPSRGIEDDIFRSNMIFCIFIISERTFLLNKLCAIILT